MAAIPLGSNCTSSAVRRSLSAPSRNYGSYSLFKDTQKIKKQDFYHINTSALSHKYSNAGFNFMIEHSKTSCGSNGSNNVLSHEDKIGCKYNTAASVFIKKATRSDSNIVMKDNAFVLNKDSKKNASTDNKELACNNISSILTDCSQSNILSSINNDNKASTKSCHSEENNTNSDATGTARCSAISSRNSNVLIGHTSNSNESYNIYNRNVANKGNNNTENEGGGNSEEVLLLEENCLKQPHLRKVILFLASSKANSNNQKNVRGIKKNEGEKSYVPLDEEDEEKAGEMTKKQKVEGKEKQALKKKAETLQKDKIRNDNCDLRPLNASGEEKTAKKKTVHFDVQDVPSDKGDGDSSFSLVTTTSSASVCTSASYTDKKSKHDCSQQRSSKRENSINKQKCVSGNENKYENYNLLKDISLIFNRSMSGERTEKEKNEDEKGGEKEEKRVNNCRNERHRFCHLFSSIAAVMVVVKSRLYKQRKLMQMNGQDRGTEKGEKEKKKETAKEGKLTRLMLKDMSIPYGVKGSFKHLSDSDNCTSSVKSKNDEGRRKALKKNTINILVNDNTDICTYARKTGLDTSNYSACVSHTLFKSSSSSALSRYSYVSSNTCGCSSVSTSSLSSSLCRMPRYPEALRWIFPNVSYVARRGGFLVGKLKFFPPVPFEHLCYSRRACKGV